MRKGVGHQSGHLHNARRGWIKRSGPTNNVAIGGSVAALLDPPYEIPWFIKKLRSDPIVMFKLEYIHANPVKRGYVELPEHWRWLSARNYIGQAELIDVEIDRL